MRTESPAGRPAALHLMVLGMSALFTLYWLLKYCAGGMVWDDSYFFLRYADNLLHGGAYAFNADGVPRYGLTSQVHGYWVLLLRTGFRDMQPALLLYLSSMSMGLLWLWQCWRLAGRWLQDRWLRLSWLAGGLALMAPWLLEHMSSGMDSMTALCALTFLLQLFFHPQPSPRRDLITGLWAGLLWLVRPELLLLLPALMLLGRDLRSRLRFLAGTCLGLGLTAALLLALYGTVIPQPLYVKTGHLLSEKAREWYTAAGLRWLCQTLLLSIAFLLPLRGKLLPLRGNVSLLLTLNALLFLVAIWLGVQQIMGYAARFYMPVFPLLITAGAWALNQTAADARWRAGYTLHPGIQAAAMVFLFFWFGWKQESRGSFLSFRAEKVYEEIGQHNWANLDRFSMLPQEVTMAATELGQMVALNPQRKIYDLSGLNEIPMPMTPADWEAFLRKEKPDLIYTPHPDYAVSCAALWATPVFREGYFHWLCEGSDCYMSISLRKESPHFQRMNSLLYMPY